MSAIRLRCPALMAMAVAMAVAVCWPAMVWSGASASVAPIAVSLVVVAALAVLVSVVAQETVLFGSGRGAHDTVVQTLSPARQCDPDAPGRARPRAPGFSARF